MLVVLAVRQSLERTSATSPPTFFRGDLRVWNRTPNSSSTAIAMRTCARLSQPSTLLLPVAGVSEIVVVVELIAHHVGNPDRISSSVKRALPLGCFCSFAGHVRDRATELEDWSKLLALVTEPARSVSGKAGDAMPRKILIGDQRSPGPLRPTPPGR